MNQLFDRGNVQEERIKELQIQVTAAEMHLTHFASRQGKDSPMYKESLRDFATAWYLLKKNRNPEDFMKEIA
jgi:hypothetical protein